MFKASKLKKLHSSKLKNGDMKGCQVLFLASTYDRIEVKHHFQDYADMKLYGVVKSHGVKEKLYEFMMNEHDKAIEHLFSVIKILLDENYTMDEIGAIVCQTCAYRNKEKFIEDDRVKNLTK